MRTDRRTDTTNLIIAFRSFVRAPEVYACVSLTLQKLHIQNGSSSKMGLRCERPEITAWVTARISTNDIYLNYVKKLKSYLTKNSLPLRYVIPPINFVQGKNYCTLRSSYNINTLCGPNVSAGGTCGYHRASNGYRVHQLPELRQLEVMQFHNRANNYIEMKQKHLKLQADFFFFSEWERSETNVAEEYWWAITQAAGRSCRDRLGSTM